MSSSINSVKPYLPPELVREVVHYLPTESLQRLSGVNRLWKVIAEDFFHSRHEADVKRVIAVLHENISADDDPCIVENLNEVFQRYMEHGYLDLAPGCKEKFRSCLLVAGLLELLQKSLASSRRPEIERTLQTLDQQLISSRYVSEDPYEPKLKSHLDELANIMPLLDDYRRQSIWINELASADPGITIASEEAQNLHKYLAETHGLKSDSGESGDLVHPHARLRTESAAVALALLNRFKDAIPERVRAWFAYAMLSQLQLEREYTHKPSWSDARFKLAFDAFRECQLAMLPQDYYPNTQCTASDHTLYQAARGVSPWSADARECIMGIENRALRLWAFTHIDDEPYIPINDQINMWLECGPDIFTTPLDHLSMPHLDQTIPELRGSRRLADFLTSMYTYFVNLQQQASPAEVSQAIADLTEAVSAPNRPYVQLVHMLSLVTGRVKASSRKAEIDAGIQQGKWSIADMGGQKGYSSYCYEHLTANERQRAIDELEKIYSDLPDQSKIVPFVINVFKESDISDATEFFLLGGVLKALDMLNTPYDDERLSFDDKATIFKTLREGRASTEADHLSQEIDLSSPYWW